MADAEAAKQETMKEVHNLIAARIRDGETVHLDHRVVVVEEGGEILHVVRFADAFRTAA